MSQVLSQFMNMLQVQIQN